MRELVVENQEVLLIPKNFKNVNKGCVTSVSADSFVLHLNTEPTDLLVNTLCEFYTQTPHGKLYFESYAVSKEGNDVVIASPTKHKFLQRRQYRRIKYQNVLTLSLGEDNYDVSTQDISAGGMKFKTPAKLDIDLEYGLAIKLSADVKVDCKFLPIRIERNKEAEYTVSGQFIYNSSRDKMLVTQYCVKRSVEINNK